MFPNPESEADHPLVAKGQEKQGRWSGLIRGCVINSLVLIPREKVEWGRGRFRLGNEPRPRKSRMGKF
jgi:hypothetical protein